LTPRKRRDRLNSLQQIAAQLRQTDDVAAPDLTGSILDQVAATRPFLDDKTRRLLWVGRASLGLSVAAVVLGVALTQRWAPRAVEFVSSRPSPLSSVVENVRNEAGIRLVGLREAAPLSSASNRSESSQQGGLLTFITSASPTPSATPASRCTLCGPRLSPSEAARMVPPSDVRATVARGGGMGEESITLADLKSAAGSASTYGRFSSRVRLGAGGLGGGSGGLGGGFGGLEAGGRVILDELTPLGSGAGADSALAPK